MATVNGKSFIFNKSASALAHYPHARSINGFLYISGTSSRRMDGSYDGVYEHADGTFTMDIQEQTKAVIQNLESIIKQASNSRFGLDAIVDVTVFLTDMSHFKAYNEVYNTFFNAMTGPCRTTIAVKQLPSPKLLIEMKAIAACPL